MADYLTKDQLRNLFQERVEKLESLGFVDKAPDPGRWLTSTSRSATAAPATRRRCRT